MATVIEEVRFKSPIDRIQIIMSGSGNPYDEHDIIAVEFFCGDSEKPIGSTGGRPNEPVAHQFTREV